MLMTQMLGAFAEFERALIRERTRAGIKAAVARGARPGNPKMRSRDPGAIAEIRASHKERHLNELLDRSEEHTSELQSLMRISYAVFCLKKNNTHTSNYNNIISRLLVSKSR